MKTLFITFFAIVGTSVVYEVNNTTAEVTKIEGIAVFHDALPVKHYTVLDQKTQSVCPMCEYSGFREKAIKHAKEVEGCNGVIISGTTCNKFKFIKIE